MSLVVVEKPWKHWNLAATPIVCLWQKSFIDGYSTAENLHYNFTNEGYSGGHPIVIHCIYTLILFEGYNGGRPIVIHCLYLHIICWCVYFIVKTQAESLMID